VNITPEQTIVEIGPGKGALTKLLAAKTENIVAIEIDPQLIQKLAAAFPCIRIISKNVLSIASDDLGVSSAKAPLSWNIVGNLPYYITSPILHTIFSWKGWQHAILMVQDEVADGMVALPGNRDYGVLSIASQIYCSAEKLFSVPSTAFQPAPKVTSAVMRLTRREKPLVGEKDDHDFFLMVKAAFSSRRKMLINSLANGWKKPKEEINALLAKAHIDPFCRPETVSIEKYIYMYQLTRLR
jgi:16S rRNA (adenine1518-N6/adenine1519-N6)-dimethyltransferase